MTHFREGRDSGAAAVEFAFISLLLMTILFGIIEGGRVFMLQTNLSAAAREAAREVALRETPDIQGVLDSSFSWGATLTSFTTCAEGDTDGEAQVTASYPTSLFGPVWPDEVTLTATGVMRCGG